MKKSDVRYFFQLSETDPHGNIRYDPTLVDQ